ncbi:EamA/RhaT family transporter, partial [Klebsiella pneumoniae]|nr:EamA/RhaT family transporter [Klebsiella pneumoniae]
MNARLGIYLKILSALCATLMLACVKGLQGAIPTGEVIFFRSF